MIIINKIEIHKKFLDSTETVCVSGQMNEPHTFTCITESWHRGTMLIKETTGV